jgi:alkanesulfonate monooxygenase SsuD/methylene tetrahydromethanopterin reductase-like flavin-dependent oxidoreductase (luciferase family)
MIAFYYRMEFYRNQAAEFGYGEQAQRAAQAWDRKDEAGALAAVSDELVDQLFICGPRKRCLEQLEAWRAAGLQLPILSARSVTGDGIEGFQDALRALGRNG